MKFTSRHLTLLLLVLVLPLSACRANVSRNNDGSLTVATTMSQQEIEEVISASIADPLIQELAVSLQSGYILVTAQRQRLNDASESDTMSFRLDLGVSSGQLTATVSEAVLDGKAIEQNRLDHWNETIASRILILGKKNPNSTLQSVEVTPEAITMMWVVSK